LAAEKGKRSSERSSQTFKKSLKPGTMLFPIPAVMVTCQGRERKPNIITIAWTGIVCSEPPMLSIAVRPERFSYSLIRQTGEFVVNIPSTHEIFWLDKFGIVSGRKIDKISISKFHLGKSEEIDVPTILECPINLECRVKKIIELGSHHLFLSEIVNVQVSEKLIDKKGRIRIEKARLVAFAHGLYFRLGKQIGRIGFTVRKKR